MPLLTLDLLDSRLQAVEAKVVIYSAAFRTLFRVMASDHMGRRALWKTGDVERSGLVQGYDPNALTVQVLADDTSQSEWIDVFSLEGFI